MSKKTISKFLIAALVVIMSACDGVGPGWEYLVDNPLSNDITINIDGKDYVIPAKTTETVKLKQGKHTLSYDGSSVNFVTKVNSNKSATLMNPTLSNYMLHANIYIKEGSRHNGEKLYQQNTREYNSDMGIVRLPVKVVNDLFMDKTHHHWSFFLDQEAKEKVSSTAPSKQVVFRKLYRQDDYMNEFAEELPSGVVFPVNSKALSEQPAYRFPTESLMSDCQAANDEAKVFEDRWNTMIATPSNIFQDVAALSYDFTAEVWGKLKKECGTQFNPGLDETKFNEALDKWRAEMSYLTDASTFIVE